MSWQSADEWIELLTVSLLAVKIKPIFKDAVEACYVDNSAVLLLRFYASSLLGNFALE